MLRNCSVSLGRWRKPLSTMMFPADPLARQKSFFSREITHSVPWNSIMECLLMVKYVNFFIDWVRSAPSGWQDVIQQQSSGHSLGLVTVGAQSKVYYKGCSPTTDVPWHASFSAQLSQVSKTQLWVQTGVILSPPVAELFPPFLVILTMMSF